MYKNNTFILHILIISVVLLNAQLLFCPLTYTIWHTSSSESIKNSLYSSGGMRYNFQRLPIKMIQSIAVRQSLLTGDTKHVLEVGIKLLLSRDCPSAAVQVDLPPKNASPSGICTLCLSRDAARLCRSAHQGAL